MGRSVSYASGAEWVMYCTPGHDDKVECAECDGTGQIDGEECPYCGGEGEDYPDQDLAAMYWDDFIGNLRTEFEAAFPSLSDCDRWLGNEDLAVLENCHAYIGVSEYMGLVSVWCVPKDGEYGEDRPLAQHWASIIHPRAEKALSRVAPRYEKLATMSNGEGVFRRAE